MTGEGFRAILAILFLKNSWDIRNISRKSLWEQGNEKVYFSFKWDGHMIKMAATPLYG